ncbi:MAG TPA: DUF547 domain-containing protein [Tepidisphaeraceae bacterium]|nr:DUF547 domain-containing protein [Tepidisphaeraceae bacterium]
MFSQQEQAPPVSPVAITRSSRRAPRQWACAPFLCMAWLLSTPAQAAPDHSTFDGILQAVVRDERVDYEKVKSDHLPVLNAYLDHLARGKPAETTRDELLAFYINLYNATMIKAVVDRGGSAFRPSDNDFAVFKEPLVRIDGKLLSLNALENDVIRKEFSDPRIHAALVCAAVSCPPILSRAYRADDLDDVLTANTKRWLNDKNRNEIDRPSKTLKLSRIFDWYNIDFGGSEKLVEYVQQYVDEDVANFKVEFKEYDWTLNKK